jgi:hypothetical protein
MSMRRTLLTTTMLTGIVGGVFLSVTRAGAADVAAVPYYKAPVILEQPAVDGINGKVEAWVGNIDRLSLYGYRGAFSIPLATQWGLQVDTSAGSLGSRAFGSIAPHLFWRDPSRGLVGLYASHTYWDQFGGVHVTQVAGEGEAYWGRFTVQGIVGVEFGNSVTSIATGGGVFPGPNPGPVPGGVPPGSIVNALFLQGYDIKTRFMDQINLKYYFTDDWNGYIGHRYLGGLNALALGTEAAVPLGWGRMGAVFVEARLGEHQFQGIWGGLKLYFGQRDKTLIRRQREDDPTYWDTLHSIVNTYGSSGTATSTPFCTPPRVLQPNGTCESLL